MKLRYFIIFMVIFLAVCLIPYPLSTFLFQYGAYAANDKYAIRQDSSQGFYIVLKERYAFSAYYSSVQSIGPVSPNFQSVKDMKASIINGNLSSSEMEALVRFPKNDSGYIICVDLENLYDAALPTDADLIHVKWYGGAYNYRFYFTYPGCSPKLNSYLYMIDQEEVKPHSEYINKEYYEKLSDNYETYTYIKSESIPERNATAHYYNYTHSIKNTSYVYLRQGRCVDLCYQLEGNGKSIYVKETYDCVTSDLSFLEANSAPCSVTITGKQDDLYFEVTLYGFSSKPTEDWLLSFGLKPYVE